MRTARIELDISHTKAAGTMESTNRTKAAKRGRRPILTCDNCRKRKAKCSREMPCALCRKTGSACEWTAHDSADRAKDVGSPSEHRSSEGSDDGESSHSNWNSQRPESEGVRSSVDPSPEIGHLKRLVTIIQSRYSIPDWEMANLRQQANENSSSQVCVSTPGLASPGSDSHSVDEMDRFHSVPPTSKDSCYWRGPTVANSSADDIPSPNFISPHTIFGEGLSSSSPYEVGETYAWNRVDVDHSCLADVDGRLDLLRRMWSE